MARRAVVEATEMAALEPVVLTVGTGRVAWEEAAAAAAAAAAGFADVGKGVAELFDEGAGEHFPKSLWQPASQ
jgi:hypothetical protein